MHDVMLIFTGEGEESYDSKEHLIRNCVYYFLLSV